LNEFAVGFWTGTALADWLPGSYVQLRYSYAFVQRVAGISHNHSNVDLETGYFLTPQWLVQASGSWQWTHGGIDIPVPPTSPLFPYHDQLADAEFFNLSGGLVWFASARTSVFFNYTQSLRGSDAHKVDQSVTLGLGYRPFAR
jgi:outer membrane receptor protein involved in Fe transport